ncbi:protein of unknown function [Candidatus Filomicrobium marinum]|nr:protein of unknown function [Candidatus Filomicrobium marinum]
MQQSESRTHHYPAWDVHRGVWRYPLGHRGTPLQCRLPVQTYPPREPPQDQAFTLDLSVPAALVAASESAPPLKADTAPLARDDVAG